MLSQEINIMCLTKPKDLHCLRTHFYQGDIKFKQKPFPKRVYMEKFALICTH